MLAVRLTHEAVRLDGASCICGQPGRTVQQAAPAAAAGYDAGGQGGQQELFKKD